VDPKAGVDVAKKKNCLPGNERQSSSPQPSHYTDSIIPAASLEETRIFKGTKKESRKIKENKEEKGKES
jgi:hypothetical protein